MELFGLLCSPKKDSDSMRMKKIILLALGGLAAWSGARAEDADTLRVVDIEEVVVIASPKENLKLREQPASATVLSQQEMQAAQVRSVKNLTGIVPNLFIPDYGSRLTTAVYIRGIGSRINTPSVGLYVDNIPLHRQIGVRLQLCGHRAY